MSQGREAEIDAREQGPQNASVPAASGAPHDAGIPVEPHDPAVVARDAPPNGPAQRPRYVRAGGDVHLRHPRRRSCLGGGGAKRLHPLDGTHLSGLGAPDHIGRVPDLPGRVVDEPELIGKREAARRASAIPHRVRVMIGVGNGSIALRCGPLEIASARTRARASQASTYGGGVHVSLNAPRTRCGRFGARDDAAVVPAPLPHIGTPIIQQ